MKAGYVVRHILDLGDKPMVLLKTGGVADTYVLCKYTSWEEYARDWFHNHELKTNDFIHPAVRLILTDKNKEN